MSRFAPIAHAPRWSTDRGVSTCVRMPAGRFACLYGVRRGCVCIATDVCKHAPPD